MGFMEFMNEQKQINRWSVFKIAMVGAIFGAALAVLFSMFGLYTI